MLYYIDGKTFVLVSGYYKEVTIKKSGNNYKVIAKTDGMKIEQKQGEFIKQISVEDAYKKSKLISDKEN